MDRRDVPRPYTHDSRPAILVPAITVGELRPILIGIDDACPIALAGVGPFVEWELIPQSTRHPKLLLRSSHVIRPGGTAALTRRTA